MDIRSVPAIDVHCHYGDCISANPVPMDSLCTGDENVVLKRMARANIKCAVVSPLKAFFPRGGGDSTAGNDEAERVCAANAPFFQWAVVNPLEPETYAQAERLLKGGKCIGVKIHPEEHIYPIKEHGPKIFEWAAGLRLVVQSHSGEQNSNPLDYLPFADAYPEVTFVLSHIGCGWDGDVTRQVRAVQGAKHGNVYTDTSSAKSITPGLIEWAVHEAGSDKIMMGTDSPLYFSPMQRARIDNAEIEDEQKLDILYRTALRVFGGALEQYYTYPV